ncbi:uncharacterized protein LOC131851656 [Achroia grisella]|uniref:uncharacterized protein LOC131851656 n=1 Tax=Achroia grisella TaxID=688607 RepID=UPI0027D28FAB|nr:uncharacterized protein LOC131851656 [Achroia grisella]
MDSSVCPQDACIRKIEDIIDIEETNGNCSVRQVAFNLPSADTTDSTVSTNLTRSLESGLTEAKQEYTNKKFMKYKVRRHKSPLPDVVSWPSDSDITVLRMKLCLNSGLKENVSSVTGDGLHQPDSSSMINLATLILHSQHPSKQNINIEEYLLPLSSWEQSQDQEIGVKDPLIEDHIADDSKKIGDDIKLHEAICSYRGNDDISLPDRGIFRRNKTSKVARFLRLYFCPCCTCLYKLEKMRDTPSVCFTNRKEFKNVIET